MTPSATPPATSSATSGDRSLRILYVGWTGFGNLGDDVCRDLFIRRIREHAAVLGRACEVRYATYQGISEQAFLEFRPHLVVLGAGSLFTVPYLQPLLLAQRHGVPTAAWGTGFDKLSARHLDEVRARRRPLTLWRGEQHADTFRQAVDACAWAGVRGPHTLKILRSAGCASPSLHVSGDPGLLLEAPGDPEPGGSGSSKPEPAGPGSLHGLADPRLLEWIAANEPIVGVNWGTANNNVYGGSEQSVAQALGRVIERLSQQSYKVLLFGVWGPDLGPLRKLAAPFEADPNVRLLRQVPSGPRLAWILGKCRFTINFKLHANVFTAAAGRPFIPLAYRSKCYDFAASVGCEELVVPFNEPDLAEAVLDRCAFVERKRKKLKERILAQKRKYVRRLESLLRSFAALDLESVWAGE